MDIGSIGVLPFTIAIRRKIDHIRIKHISKRATISRDRMDGNKPVYSPVTIDKPEKGLTLFLWMVV